MQQSLTNEKSILIEVMAHGKGNKPLSDPMLTKIYVAI